MTYGTESWSTTKKNVRIIGIARRGMERGITNVDRKAVRAVIRFNFLLEIKGKLDVVLELSNLNVVYLTLK